jgi:hypothetical protein
LNTPSVWTDPASSLLIEYPGAVYHVMARGNVQSPIYLDDAHVSECPRQGGIQSQLALPRLLSYDQPLRPYYYLLIEIPVGNPLKFQGNNVTLISCFCLSPFRLFFLRSQQLETRPSFEPSKTLAFLFIRPLQKRRDCIILREAES